MHQSEWSLPSILRVNGSGSQTYWDARDNWSVTVSLHHVTLGVESISPARIMEFTDQQVDKALEPVNKAYKINGGHFEIARAKYHQETLQVFQEVFWVDEPICRSLGLGWSQEVADFHMGVIQQNLTLIAVNDSNGEIMGIRIIATSTINDKTADPPVFTDDRVQQLFNLLNHMSLKADVCTQYDVTQMFEFVALAVTRNYRQQGLGTKLMGAAVDLVKLLATDKQACITGLGTSRYSQSIFERLGFESVYSLQYRDYMVDGETVINNTGEHEKIVCYVMKI